MEEVQETYNKNEGIIDANNPKHYKIIVIGIVVGLIGIMLRFLSDYKFIDMISNIIFVLGIFICIKSVLNILK